MKKLTSLDYLDIVPFLAYRGARVVLGCRFVDEFFQKKI